MATEVDWSELPKELLNLISQCIDNELDLIHFRSICSTWRSSSIPNHHSNISSFKFPKYIPPPYSTKNDDNDIIHFIKNSNSPFDSFSKRSLFLVKAPPHQTVVLRPWLMQICPSSLPNKRGKIMLTYSHPPIRHESAKQLQETLIERADVLDFNKLSVLHLGTRYISNQYGKCPETALAVTCHGKNPLLLGTLSHFSHLPVIFRGCNEQWKLFSNLSTVRGDICLFKGRFYVVEMSGRTVKIGPDLTMVLVAQPLYNLLGDSLIRKMLVESEGELLLLDIYQSLYQFRIDFFKLDEKEKKWVKLMDYDKKLEKWKLKNFGDMVFFLGSGCSFSASASDLCLTKGNCVIFIDYYVLSRDDLTHGYRVFHLERNQLSRVSEYPEYFNLFLPPKWILKI
ncbi:hypothetical protein MtrunA17_Chr3g0088921 [Medicago truncatula]|uniref:F-box SKIP23-like protein n=1 Tax=Medicago truncatula TaxID=3880 RepID=A0A072UUC6_MEDTR|nr:F-box protein SKIP23 [Medicago truncatula]KEH33242.1 F-box SKIP23-like protein [Medicago truncatula]RHN66259.1 hypothetical protein MtrunA17_Chr3g0088921 [Medicago truncatula]